MKKLGHYNLIQTDAGWHSTLCAGNNKVILTTTKTRSEQWKSKNDIDTTVALSLSGWCSAIIQIDKRESQDKKHYFCISEYREGVYIDYWISETYNTKQSMERGIKSVLANAKTTDVRIVDRRTKK